MTLKRFIKKYIGVRGVGNTKKNRGQCVGLVQVWIAALGLSHIWGNARDIFANASPNEYEKIENSPNIYPIEGSILCWNSTMGDGDGHTAIVVSSDPKKDTVEVFESNNPLGNTPRIHTYFNWRGIIGWLKPYVLEGEENIPSDSTGECLIYKERIEALLEAEESLEEKLDNSKINEEKVVKKINGLDKTYAGLKKTYAKEIKLLIEQRKEAQKDYTDLYATFEKDSKTAFDTIQELKKHLINLQKGETDMVKNTRDYMSDVVKYAGPSSAVALATSEILVFLVGGLEPIKTALALVIGFSINLLLVVLKSKGIIYKN